MSEQDKDFHESFKPSWATNGTLVYASSSETNQAQDGVLTNLGAPIVYNGQDVQLARITESSDEVCSVCRIIKCSTTKVSRSHHWSSTNKRR